MRLFGEPLDHGDELGAPGFEAETEVPAEAEIDQEAAAGHAPGRRQPAEDGRAPGRGAPSAPPDRETPERQQLVQGRLRALSDGSPGEPPATALDRRALAHWQQAGGYSDETVSALAGLVCGEKVVERLSREQLKRVTELLELAVAGRSRSAPWPVRLAGPRGATTSPRAPRSSSAGCARRPPGSACSAGARRHSEMGENAAAAARWAAVHSLAVPRRLPLRSDDTRLMQLSVSSLALFWRCPERWRRRYLEREREPQTGPMLVGKAVAATVGAYFAARMAGEDLSAADADDLCRAEFDERLGQAGTELAGDEPDVLREQSREALRAYLTELAPGVRPISVERRFELRFEGAEWSLVGYLDVEDASGDTIDVKVGSKHVSEARAASDPQPTTYELAKRAEGRPEGFLFHSVRRGQVRSGERCLVVRAQRSPARLAAMEARIAQTARQIAHCAETGDWPLSTPDGWWCTPGHCRFWASCPGGGVRA